MDSSEAVTSQQARPAALHLLVSERPRNVSWFGAAGFLFGDWGTSRLYVLGIAFLVAGRTSFYLIAAMSLLILAVGWGYTQICRIYPDGGGVYSAAKQRSRLLAVVGALLLFADYTVTASLSALDAFHYFGLGRQQSAQVAPTQDAGDAIILEEENVTAAAPEPLLSWRSPGLWAILSILAIAAFNQLGPKHSSSYAAATAGAMVAITLLVVVCALPQVDWRHLHFGAFSHRPLHLWEAFVAIVLALSGVEAIANLTGVMNRPVYGTAKKSIWTVAGEVAAFNLLLALVMIAIPVMSRDAHKEDMLAFLAEHYVGLWGAWPVRVVGGLLLLSATNTAINGLMSITYVMSRDGELPAFFQRLNGFGAPWIGALVAGLVPAIVLLFAHDLVTLASLYAIGVVGAVSINITLCAFHPRLRRWWRRMPMLALGVFLTGVEVTLACTKLHALVFATIVLAVGLILRQITRAAAARHPKPSLLRQAIIEQLAPAALAKPRMLLATAGSTQNAEAAIRTAQAAGAALVVCFVRQLSLTFMVGGRNRLTLDTDLAAQNLFVDFLDLGQRYGVPIIPMYDIGDEATELIAEHAAMNGVQSVFIGSSRRGTLHQIIKGSFQRKLEALLPPEIRVQVLSDGEIPAQVPGAIP
jgi:amino acid transporter